MSDQCSIWACHPCFLDTGAILCICTSGSDARGAMHEIGWKKFKQPGHVHMILGMHRSSLWYMWYDYMHVWYCFYVQLYLIILYALSEMTNKRWTFIYISLLCFCVILDRATAILKYFSYKDMGQSTQIIPIYIYINIYMLKAKYCIFTINLDI